MWILTRQTCLLGSAAVGGSCSEWEATEIGTGGEGSIVTAGQVAAQKISRHPTLGASAVHIPQIPSALSFLCTAIDHT